MKQFEPSLTDQERVKVLNENAASIEKDATYQKELTQEELAARREDLADNCIKLNQYSDELKIVKDAFK